MNKTIIQNRFIFTFFLLVLCNVAKAQEQRAQGVVTSMESGSVIAGVHILLDGVNICSSDADGKFSTNVSPSAQLVTYHPSYESQTINVDGQQIISIALIGRTLEIEEVVITAKTSTSKVVIEPTEIEVKGEYFYLKSRFTIPTQLFKPDNRFIIQPTIFNITKESRSLLRPVVMDGRRYEIVEHRFLGFNDDNDKLHPYVVPNDITRKENIYTYRDSIRMSPEQINDNYRAECFLVLTGYKEGFSYEDSVTIAKGTRNPLYFLSTPLCPISLNGDMVEKLDEFSTSDSLYAPQPEFCLLSDKGESEIIFAINSTQINLNFGENRDEFSKIEQLISKIERDRDSRLESIEIVGYASPDGTYEANLSLAQGRTDAIVLQIKSMLSDSESAKFIRFSSEGKVQNWSALLEIISPEDQYLKDTLENIIATYGDNYTTTSRAIMGLKEYRSVISKKYLPKLRRVEYSINYSQFREHNISEIETTYNYNREAMTRYNTYKLIKECKDRVLREEIEDFAISKFEHFTWAANRVAIRNILASSAHLDLLKPFITEDNTPQAILYNQAIIAMNNRDIDYAIELLDMVNVSNTSIGAKAYLSALSGDYKSAYPFFEQEGGINLVILLLAMERDLEAYELMKGIIQDKKSQDDAKHCYILAMCANRVDDLTIAIALLERAFMLDDSLKERAKVDSDVIDIFQIVTSK